MEAAGGDRLTDVFFSYRRHDLVRAQPLLDALAAAGVRVWRDEREIPEHGSITEEIRQGIANSRGFLAFYSKTYPESGPCQQEITAAWLADERRVWIVNPEAGFEHLPELLRDRQMARASVDESGRAIRERLGALCSTLLGKAGELPAYYGMSATQTRLFVGRVRELWDLHGQLTANRRSIITRVYGQAAAQVRGLGGNGKSMLAREYAIRFGPAYPGGVFLMRASGRDDQMREFAVRMGVAIEGLKPEEIETLFWRELEKRGRRCLWIVDDVPSGLRLQDLERDWDARWTGASTLFTTRSKEYGALGRSLDLGVLSPGEALDLLCSQRATKGDAEERAAREIVKLLGYHPLAVAVAGSYLGGGFGTFESYVEALDNPGEDAVEFGASLIESLPTGHERSISATLLGSIRQLGLEGQDFLRLASVLAVAPIQVSFVAEVFELLDAGAGRSRAVAGVDQAGALSLCERSGEDGRAVHTLVSRTMRSKSSDGERTVELRSAAVLALARRLAAPAHIGEHAKIAIDMPHSRHLVEDGLRTEQEATLGAWVAHRDYERADYVSARKLDEQVLEARRRLLGEEHPDTLTAMSNIASTMRAQGDLAQAQILEELALEAFRRLLGAEHPDTLKATACRALTLSKQGDLAEARKLQEQVLQARRRICSEEHPDTLKAMHNLAQTLCEQGDLPAARALHEQELEASRRLLGDEHPDTVTGMHNLARTLCEQGDWEGARKLQEEVLAIRRRLLGDRHPDTLTAMNNLAGTQYEMGDVAGARNLQERVLEARRRLLGDQHSETLTAMGNLAATLKAEGDLAEARKLQEQALEVSRRMLGDEHPDTLWAINNLAATLYAEDALAGARKLQQQVVKALRRLLGNEHPSTLTAMNNLARTMYAQGERKEARELQEAVVDARRRVLGEEHPKTLTSISTLAQMIDPE